MILALFVVLFVVSYLLKTVEDGSNDAQTRPRRWWQGNLPRFRGFLDKPLPSSAIKIIVVVLQIVIQVRATGESLVPNAPEMYTVGWFRWIMRSSSRHCAYVVKEGVKLNEHIKPRRRYKTITATPNVHSRC